MTTLPKQILSLVVKSPGLTDREITNALRGVCAPQQPVNQAARSLESQGILVRLRRDDGLIGNYVTEKEVPMVLRPDSSSVNHDAAGLSEDEIKKVLKVWLSEQGWSVKIAMGQARGIDIDATRGKERWIIEVKGTGKYPQMRVNYFLCILGETLQRMDDPAALYSLALPDLEQFKKLWGRLPILAKDRTQISVLFVSKSGAVAHVK
jgi:hypothetical protein